MLIETQFCYLSVSFSLSGNEKLLFYIVVAIHILVTADINGPTLVQIKQGTTFVAG